MVFLLNYYSPNRTWPWLSGLEIWCYHYIQMHWGRGMALFYCSHWEHDPIIKLNLTFMGNLVRWVCITSPITWYTFSCSDSYGCSWLSTFWLWVMRIWLRLGQPISISNLWLIMVNPLLPPVYFKPILAGCETCLCLVYAVKHSKTAMLERCCIKMQNLAS